MTLPFPGFLPYACSFLLTTSCFPIHFFLRRWGVRIFFKPPTFGCGIASEVFHRNPQLMNAIRATLIKFINIGPAFIICKPQPLAVQFSAKAFHIKIVIGPKNNS